MNDRNDNAGESAVDLPRIERAVREILAAVGEDPDRDGLLNTPGRAARAMQYLTRGYNQSLDEVVNNAIFESDNDEMILVKNI